MRLLQYKDLDLRRVKPAFAKVRSAIDADNFKSPDVKKLHVAGYYRAKLDASNRLLLQFARHGAETVCLALEFIANHAYDKWIARCGRASTLGAASHVLQGTTLPGSTMSGQATQALHAYEPAFRFPRFTDRKMEGRPRKHLPELVPVG